MILCLELKRDQTVFTFEGAGQFVPEGTSVEQWLSEEKKAAYLAQTDTPATSGLFFVSTAICGVV